MMPFGLDTDFHLKYGTPFSTGPYTKELEGRRADLKYEYFLASPNVLLRIQYAPGGTVSRVPEQCFKPEAGKEFPILCGSVRWKSLLQDWIYMVDNKPLLPPED